MEGKLYLQAEKSYPLRTTFVLLGFRNHPNLHRDALEIVGRFESQSFDVLGSTKNSIFRYLRHAGMLARGLIAGISVNHIG